MLCGVGAQYTEKDECDFCNYDPYQNPWIMHDITDKGSL